MRLRTQTHMRAQSLQKVRSRVAMQGYSLSLRAPEHHASCPCPLPPASIPLLLPLPHSVHFCHSPDGESLRNSMPQSGFLKFLRPKNGQRFGILVPLCCCLPHTAPPHCCCGSPSLCGCCRAKCLL